MEFMTQSFNDLKMAFCIPVKPKKQVVKLGDEFTRGRLLGQGGYGDVYEGI